MSRLLAQIGRANRLVNVRFEGNNGHDVDVTRCPLMTRSGHAAHVVPAQLPNYSFFR